MMSIISNAILFMITFLYPLLPLVKEHSLMVGNFIELFLILLLTVSAIVHKKGGKIHLEMPARFLLALAVLLAAFLFNLTDFFDNEIYDIVSAARMFFFYIVLMAYLDTTLKDDSASSYRIVKYLLFTMSVFTAGAIIQFVYPDVILLFHGPDTITELRPKSDFIAFSVFNRCMSFFGDPNILGTFSSLCFIFFHQCKLYINQKRTYAYALGICIVSILLSQSRTAILLLVIYFAIYYLYSLNRLKKVSVIGLVLGGCFIAIALYIMYTHWDVILNYLRIDTLLNGNGRMEHNAEHISYLFSENNASIFLGHGLSVARHVIFENSYLLLFYEFGIVGFLIFLLETFSIIRKNIQPYQCKILLFCFLIVNLVGDYILIPQITYLSVLTIYSLYYLLKENSR
jgi:hypothetical protein